MVARPQQMANLRRNTPPADLAQQMRTLQEIWKREDEAKAKKEKKAEEQKFRSSMLRAGEAAFGGIPILGDFVQGAKEGFAIKDFLANLRERKEKRQEPPMPALKAYAASASPTPTAGRRRKAPRTPKPPARMKGRLPVMGPLGAGRKKTPLPKPPTPQQQQAKRTLAARQRLQGRPKANAPLAGTKAQKQAARKRLPPLPKLTKPQAQQQAQRTQVARHRLAKLGRKQANVPLAGTKARKQQAKATTPKSTPSRVPVRAPKAPPTPSVKAPVWASPIANQPKLGGKAVVKASVGTPKIIPPRFKAKGTPQQRRQVLNQGMGRRVNKALGNVGKRQPSLTGSKMASVAAKKGLPKMRPEAAGGMGTSGGKGGPDKTAEAMEKLTEKLDDLTDEVKDLNKHMGKQGSKGQSGAPTRSGGPTVVTGTRPNPVRPAVSATQPRLPANRPAPIPPT